jgi:hypothetical protein
VSRTIHNLKTSNQAISYKSIGVETGIYYAKLKKYEEVTEQVDNAIAEYHLQLRQQDEKYETTLLAKVNEAIWNLQQESPLVQLAQIAERVGLSIMELRSFRRIRRTLETLAQNNRQHRMS